MKSALRAFLCALFALAIAAPATAQDETPPAVLIADRLEYDVEAGTVTAIGSVEVYYKGRILTAERIFFDETNDRVEAFGAITLTDASGAVIQADGAALDADLTAGVAQGARLILADGRAKAAAVEVRRVNGRYDVLDKAVYSPCEVCEANPVPLWRIRAERVVRDDVKGRIYYQDAYFDLMGVNIGYLPYFRHASPENRRDSGFLAPLIKNDGIYGPAVKLPYYFELGDYSDLTLTPFVALNDGALMEVEYRQRWTTASLDLDVAFGGTDYDDGDGLTPRFGGFGTGRWTVEDGLYAGFDMAFAADDPFLRRYDYTLDDRLTTDAFLRHYDGRDQATVGVAYMQSLRAGEAQGTIPLALPEVSARKVFAAPGVGGDLALFLDGQGAVREDGRDVGRLSLGVEWDRSVIVGPGVVATGFAGARVDQFAVGDDGAFDDAATRLVPRVGARLAWPLARVTGDRVETLEPAAQFTFAPDDLENGEVPNEDSVLTEFTTANLFDKDRFAGFDQAESGANFTLGVAYGLTEGDYALDVAAGRVLRLSDNGDFTAGSGLDGATSDWVASLDVTAFDWLSLQSDWRLSDGFGVNKAEVQARADVAPFTLAAGFLHREADPAAGAAAERTEVLASVRWTINENWRATSEARYDLELDEFVTLGGAVGYENECARLEAFARRRFADAPDAPSATSFGVRVKLFGAGGDPAKASGACDYGG